MVAENQVSAVARFQSTLSMRRATAEPSETADMLIISIHALHEESDLGLSDIFRMEAGFQSTLSMRRATSR